MSKKHVEYPVVTRYMAVSLYLIGYKVRDIADAMRIKRPESIKRWAKEDK